MKKLIVLLVLLIGLGIAEVKHEYFRTVEKMMTKIDKLNAYEYESLKIFVIPSSRGLNAFGKPYNIIYKAQ